MTSFEWNSKKIPKDLPVVLGDGQRLIPVWLDSHPNRAVGILLDGPKGPRGTALREVCLQYPDVRVVGQHDSPQGAGEDAHSQDPRFRHDVGDRIDDRVPSAVRAAYPHGAPGLGIWINRGRP